MSWQRKLASTLTFFFVFFKSTSQHLFGIGHLDHFEGVQNSSIHRQSGGSDESKERCCSPDKKLTKKIYISFAAAEGLKF